MDRLYRQATLNRGSSLLLEALLLLDGPYRFGHGLEPSPGYGVPAVVGEPVGALFYLLQRPVDFSEAALDLFPYGGVHLAGEHILAQVARVELGVPFGLAEVPFVFGHAFLYAHQFIAQTKQPLSLALYELLVQLLISQLVPPGLFQSTQSSADYVYPNTLSETRYTATTTP